ncbi:MAG: Ser-Thr-rich GPI-anchored membrane family protein [Candidatus Eisenbacteria bacterium]
MTRPQRLLTVLVGVAVALSLTTCSDDDSSSNPTCHLMVVSPNGGEVLSAGQAYSIQWMSDGPCSGTVDIELMKDGEVRTTIAENAPNTGSYTWQCQGGEGDAGYYLRLTLNDGSSRKTDMSDAGFRISAAPASCAITVAAPIAGARFVQGQIVPIAWEAGGTCDGAVRIELLHLGASCTVIAESTENDGAFDWTAARCVTDSTGYAVRVTDVESGATDFSSGTFTIGNGEAGTCTLQLTRPNGGESWIEGARVQIEWDHAGSAGPTVSLELLRDGEVCAVIAAATDNDGSFEWTAARCATASAGYHVRIADPACGARDLSDASFAILPASQNECHLTVTRPYAGEQLVSGETFTILWNTTEACGDQVRIELYRLGALCQIISETTANDGAYEWVVDGCGSADCGYTVRVIDLDSGSADDSDGHGIQTVCELEVLSPNGGESYYVGEQVLIAWQASDCASQVRIDLLQDGQVCRTLVTHTANDGMFVWTRAAQCDGPDGYVIRITDLETGTLDESDAPFRIITPCSLRITAPSGGNTWTVDDILSIEWVLAGDACGDLALIELLRGDEVCMVITPETLNDGQFDWAVAQCLDFTNGYVIRVTDITSGASDETDGMLDIFYFPPETCEIALLAPTAGAELCAGRPIDIRWSFNDFCGSQVMIELLQGATVCATVAPTTANDGVFSWTPAPCGDQTEGYRLRITDLGTEIVAESAADFAILPGCALSLQAPSGGSFCAGTSVPIEWTATPCCGDQVRLELLLDGVVCSTIAAATDNDGSHPWTAEPCGEADGGYAIRVTDLDTGATAASAVEFDIQQACAIAVTSPTGVEILCAGADELPISWTTVDCCGATAKIELLLNGTVCAVIAATTENDGSFPWPVEQCAAATDGYTIRVTDLVSGASGENPLAFAIEAPCRIDLTVPNGGQDLCTGDPLEILWSSSSCCGATVKIELVHDGGVCETIAAAADNNGSLTWIPVQCAGEADGYRIRVTDLTTGAADESALDFSIHPACEITLLEPDGDEPLCAGTPIDILWTPSTCCGDQVSIELVHGGTACLTIAAATANDGRHEWMPEPCAGVTGDYRIRVTDLVTGATDESDALFDIEPGCQLTVTAPPAGLVVCEGTPIDIRWTPTTCCGELVKIQLICNGVMRSTIAAETANDGAFTWNADQAGNDSSGYTIRVTDLESDVAGESPFSFTIHAGCAVELFSPRNGDLFCIGDPVAIVWDPGSPCCGDLVRIQLYRYGNLVSTLAASTENDGAYTWPSAQQHNGLPHGYAIMVTNLATGAANGIDWAFSIGGGDVSVSYPNGGETICSGLPVTMRWNRSSCYGPTVKIELLHDGTVCRTLAASTGNGGTFHWIAEQCGSFEEGYTVRITDLESGSVDVSDGPFVIHPPCDLSISRPQAGDIYCVGDPVLIRWDASPCCGDDIRLDLVRNGSPCLLIAELDGGPSRSYEYIWTAAQCAGQSAGYKVRVTDLDSGLYAETGGTFTINPACVITITSPNNGEVLTAGESAPIAWDFGYCCGETASIELLLDGVVCLVITAATPNDGSFPWIAEQCGAAIEGYEIRVTDLETGAWDLTDVGFRIEPACEVLVTAPASGEYCPDDPVGIVWTAEGCGADVKIELLLDDAVCATIAAATANDGAHAWPAAACGEATGPYRVRVTDLETGIAAESPAGFVIHTPCDVRVVWPSRAELLCTGREYQLLWNASPCCGEFVRLDLYRLGEPCVEIAASTANDGAHPWTAAMCAPEPWEDIEPWGATGGYQLRVTDLTTGAYDESNIAFKVLPTCEVTVLGPNGGEVFTVGESIPIVWESSECHEHGYCCGELAKIELLRAGSVCAVLAESTPNDGSFAWPAAQCDGQSNSYMVRVTDLETGATDRSNRSFDIVTPCLPVVLSPNGGESLCVGENVTLDWETSGDCSGNVRLDLVRDGSPCRLIAATTADDGSHTWRAAMCSAETEGYRLRVTDLGSGDYDESDATFAIQPRCAIGVQEPTNGASYRDNDEITISWTRSACCGEIVRIDLAFDGTLCEVIDKTTPNDGSYSWTVHPCGTQRGLYQIRVTDPASGAFGDSYGGFDILPACALEMTAPAGGENYCTGVSVPIRWTADPGCGGSVRIELLAGGLYCATISEATTNDGAFDWPAAPCGADPGSLAIRVTDIETGVSAVSSGAFAVGPACLLAVHDPEHAGGAEGLSFCQGEPVLITWDSSACCGSSSMAIDLVLAGGVCHPITDDTPNDGSYTWTAWRCGDVEDGYRIRVTDLGTGTSATNDTDFSIRPPCALDVSYPDGGESIVNGSWIAITWDTTACCGDHVELELLRDGESCGQIEASTDNDGTHAWLAAQCDSHETGYQVRIIDLSTSNSNVSDATFAISATGPRTTGTQASR